MKPTRALFALFLVPVLAASAQSGPTLTVDAGANQHQINPNIYGIVSYGLDTGFAKEIKVPNVRWGGDGTTAFKPTPFPEPRQTRWFGRMGRLVRSSRSRSFRSLTRAPPGTAVFLFPCMVLSSPRTLTFTRMETTAAIVFRPRELN